jgi:hypothetical protein
LLIFACNLLSLSAAICKKYSLTFTCPRIVI